MLANQVSAPGLLAAGELLQVDDLRFAVKRSERRKTLEITVERDGSLAISGPPGATWAQMEAFAKAKRFWVYTKLAEKDRLLRSMPAKQYVTGEGFLYLGRTYRLKLVDAAPGQAALKLINGRFALSRAALPEAREQFVRWYGERARLWLTGKLADYLSRMEVATGGIKVQDLGYRWGSCGKGGWLYFHWKTVLLPARIAEYVLVHELAHLHEPHHTPDFWLRVERAMPDYERRKAWLAEHGIEVEGI